MNMGTPEILIIALVVVLLFGATKLPQMARSLGQSARVFKAEARGLKEDEQSAQQSAQQGTPSGSADQKNGPNQGSSNQGSSNQGSNGTRQLDDGSGRANPAQSTDKQSNTEN